VVMVLADLVWSHKAVFLMKVLEGFVANNQKIMKKIIIAFILGVVAVLGAQWLFGVGHKSAERFDESPLAGIEVAQKAGGTAEQASEGAESAQEDTPNAQNTDAQTFALNTRAELVELEADGGVATAEKGGEGSAESERRFGLEKPEIFGKIVSDIHNNLRSGTTEAITLLNFAIDDAVYVSARVGDEVIKYNIEKYQVDEKTKKIYLKIRDNQSVSRWIAVTKAGHEKLLQALERMVK